MSEVYKNKRKGGVKKIVIVAGDKSGDLYGGFLAKKLKDKFSSLEIFSFGGSNLAQYSQQIINLFAHSVSGIFEVLLHLGKILKVFKKTCKEIERIKPDLIILIDFPDFNLRLAKSLNKKIPIFYYVSPQIWAWRKKRIELIKKYVEKMIVIFKFEEDFYKKEGVDVLYFGHPLLDLISCASREEKKQAEPKRIISLMPGSRKNEIMRHLPLMLKAKKNIETELKDYQFRIIRPEDLEENFYKKISPDTKIVPHSYEAIEESEFIVTSSGTATIEIAILGVPFLIIYKVNPFTFWILRKMVNAEFIGMVNILRSKKIIEELLQNKVNPKNIAQKTLECLKNKEKYQQIEYELKKIRKILEPQGATDRFADFIGGYLLKSLV